MAAGSRGFRFSLQTLTANLPRRVRLAAERALALRLWLNLLDFIASFLANGSSVLAFCINALAGLATQTATGLHCSAIPKSEYSRACRRSWRCPSPLSLLSSCDSGYGSHNSGSSRASAGQAILGLFLWWHKGEAAQSPRLKRAASPESTSARPGRVSWNPN